MVSINSLNIRIARRRAPIDAALARVFDRAWLVAGPEVDAFEAEFAKYIGVNFCRGVANGTDALELALRALGVTRDTLVATVANAGFYTSTALLAIGAKPFYLDVDLETRSVTLREVDRALSVGAEAIVVTHLYGLAVPEIDKISALCKSRNVPLLEDCAQAHGARIGGNRVGTFGDAASFSFYPTKNLGALGDGGAVVTNNPEVADRVKRLRQYGWASKYQVEMAGARNSRLDELQAAILSIFLPDLDSVNERRRSIATYYGNSIRHPNVRLPKICGDESVAHLYVVRVQDRDSLRAHLKAHNIATDVHYPIPDYRQPIFGGKYRNFHLPNTDLLADEIMTLPLYPEMSDTEVEKVVASVNAW